MTVELSDAPVARVEAPAGVLAFRVGREEYAIDILKVQEIRGYDRPTRIAQADPALCGVVNLRGIVVPIVDLRRLMGTEDVSYDASTVTIVLALGRRIVGIVVDAVADVLDLDPSQLREAPAMSSSSLAGHILGIASIGERILMVLDIEGYMEGLRV